MEKWKGAAFMWNIGRKQRLIDEEDHKGWSLYHLEGPPWSYKINENKKDSIISRHLSPQSPIFFFSTTLFRETMQFRSIGTWMDIMIMSGFKTMRMLSEIFIDHCESSFHINSEIQTHP
ncbi:unnamed protein product [Sphenostylis stenocarpa]|uniref:Uncharacterized protein n=1 Tax=Sphenostylis stenocarpa TaxID=92480 RepID=A0AA86S1A3_9FABA|nr:unnamed protein product [Sphenostylis stenocarpa]